MNTTIQFRCPSCGANRVASSTIAGRRVRCPSCGSILTVPKPNSPQGAGAPAPVRTVTKQKKKDEFDPYYQWLAIPPSEQPPNHYRLLGVALFEPDDNVIAVSADRQMVHVKAQSTGKYVKQSQKLLNELARARACLLDPKKRAEYDAKLRAELQAKGMSTAVGATPAQPAPQLGTGAAATPAAAPGTAPAQPRAPAGTRLPGGTTLPTRPQPVTARPSAPRPAARRAGVPAAATPAAPRADAERQRWKTPQRKAPPKAVEEPTEPAVSFRDEEHERLEAEMDMTPMVDVTFLLLIFFMVTAAFSLQRSLEMPTPKQDEPSANVQTIEDFEDNPDFVVVRVDAYNTYHVSTIDWEEEAPSEQDLLIHLRRARQGNSEGKIPTRLLVVAHGDALYEKVIAAMDAGTSVGMEEIQVVNTEEEIE